MSGDALEKLEGRIRAIEAILLEMPGLSPSTIEAAALRLQTDYVFERVVERKRLGGTVERGRSTFIGAIASFLKESRVVSKDQRGWP